jgi:hypothetical protein
LSVFDVRHIEIAQLAERQQGHVARWQLLDMGVSPGTISSWLARGELVRVHQGVYALRYRRVEPVARAMAAVLACGPGAVLSHDSALALWGLRRWPAMPEVTAARCVRRPGITAHRSTTLTPADTTRQLGVPVTRAARAITDIRPRLTERQFTRLANDARLQRVITGDEAKLLLGHDRNATASGHEDDFQRFIERYGLPQPLTEVWIGGRRVDALWPEEKVIVEIDDYGTHGDPATFQSDRDRDNDHLDKGFVTRRLTVDRFDADQAARLNRLILSRRPGRRTSGRPGHPAPSTPPAPDPPEC